MTTTLDICTICADEIPGTTPGAYARICESCRADDETRELPELLEMLDDLDVDVIDAHNVEHATPVASCAVCYAYNVCSEIYERCNAGADS